MAKKRKVGVTSAPVAARTKYGLEERFDDSEDEFYAGRDKILLDEEPASKRRRRLEEQERDLQPSDEEVLGYESEPESDDADPTPDENEDEEEEEDGETWGTTKADYYNADTIETEADALEEEAEARRLQQKQLKTMTEADFGFDETTWVDTQPAQRGPIVEKLPDVRIPASATQDDKLNLLKSRYPEFTPLARDFVELQQTWQDLNQAGPSTKLRALSTYLGAVAMYFAILTTTSDTKAEAGRITALPPNDLRDHAIIDNLMKSRELWDAAKDMESEDEEVESVIDLPQKKAQTQVLKKSRAAAVSTPAPKTKPTKESLRVEKAVKERKPKEKKSKEKSSTKSKLIDLQTLLAQPAAVQEEEDTDFGDEAPLTEEQAADKAKRKKSLRFYTSQIAQKANKRGAASRGAGGDDDVPHKERTRDKQDRLMKEAEKRGQQKPDDLEELDDVSVTAGQDDEYYTSLVAKNNQKKADKSARAEAYAEAARQGGQVYEEEQVGADGKRAITYAIEKNKGLMPKRKKDVRNPRVKKKKKYEEKMKKLGSMRQVYKGGEGRGGYGGELTGIKTNVVKSVKL